jgi:predicted thioredoxin/glutaredoxin
MPKVELVYFIGCPNVDHARNAIRAAGVSDFVELEQDRLPKEHAYRRYSSPSILIDGEILAGSEGGSSCSIIDWKDVSARIAERFRKQAKSPMRNAPFRNP